jgi:hypothetical protein
LHPISVTKGHNYLLEHVENRTATLLLNIQAEIQNPAAHMLHFFCLSANIYIYAVLREIPLKAPYFSIMVMRLHDAAVRVNFEELSEPTLRKALWMFLVGRLAAHERPEHQWFDEHLLQVVKFCRLDKEDAVRTVVRQLLWPNEKQGAWILAPDHKRNGHSGEHVAHTSQVLLSYKIVEAWVTWADSPCVTSDATRRKG